MIWDFSPKYRFLIHQRNDIMKSRPAQCNYFIRNVVIYTIHCISSYVLPPLLFKLQEFVQYSFVGLSVSVHGGGWNKIKIVYLKIRSICQTVTMTSFFLQIWVDGLKCPKYYLSTASAEQGYWLLTIPRPQDITQTVQFLSKSVILSLSRCQVSKCHVNEVFLFIPRCLLNNLSWV